MDDPRSEAVFLHEFAHSLAYLADEYIGAVTYSDIYPEGVEPVEPNITRELDREKLKWRSLLSQGVPLPTPKDFSGQIQGQASVVGAFEGAVICELGCTVRRGPVRWAMDSNPSNFVSFADRRSSG